MKEVIHFAHGNGFPSPCYRQLLSSLGTQFDCYYIDRVGHTLEYPVTDNWQYLVNELIASVKRQVHQPVIAVGHSLGGILSLLAAIEQPALFKSVVLLDSPLLGRLKSNIVRLSKVLGVIDRLTPAHRSRQRERHWPCRTDALSYLKSRSLFKTFTDECLNDYIDYGMQNNEDGYFLRFDPRIEYQIYRTIPHILNQYEGLLQIPTTLIYGSKTNVVAKTDLHYMKKKYGINHYEIDGTHMFPMEYPEITANLIIDILSKE